MIIFNEIVNKFKKDKMLDEYGISMVSFFLYGLSFNMFISIFVITLFFYKKKIIGTKGKKGDTMKEGSMVKMIFVTYVIKSRRNYQRTKNWNKLYELINTQKLMTLKRKD